MLASSTSYFSPLSSLIHHGSTLSSLLAKIRQCSTNKSQIPEISFHEQVGCCVDELLQDLNKAQSPFLDECMVKVMTKIEMLLQRFVEVDKVHVEFYDELAEKVKTFKSRWQQYSSALTISSSPNDSSSDQHQPDSDINSPQESDFESNYKNLTDNEKLCLFYFSLFPVDVGIRRRDLIYCWLGMGFIHPGNSDGELVLAKLVAEGFIRNNKLSSRYKMRASIHSKVQQAAWDSRSLKATKERSFSIIHRVGDKTDQPPEPEKIEALLNIDEHTFKAGTFSWVSKMKNAKVVHLGSWRHHHDIDGTDSSIVVEDTEFLKALKQLSQVRFLSLGGISGIVVLPDSVCKLERLQVLDLRACNNLESLPRGIQSLLQLTHLDLSECYLLDHIPKGISSLPNLIVLKGFVINPSQHSVVGSNGNPESKASSPCAFSDLSELKQLRKLTIRTRRMNFPTQEDLQILYRMKLNNLGITWVGNSSDAQTDSDLDQFPATVKKLELQIAPKCAASRLLEIISKQRDVLLQKLYIKGGGLRKLDREKHYFAHVKVVRLSDSIFRDVTQSWRADVRSQMAKIGPKFNTSLNYLCFELPAT